MNVEQDYIMRMIKEFANVLGRLLFNKKKPMYELDVTNRYLSLIHIFPGKKSGKNQVDICTITSMNWIVYSF